MSLGETILSFIKNRRQRKLQALDGPLGDFYRAGGNALLYDLPVQTGDLVIDGGGYKGEWTAGMIKRYGCKSDIYEAIPAYARQCADYFSHNQLVRVHPQALGNTTRHTSFTLHDNGTSEYLGGGQSIDVQVLDIASIFANLQQTQISCLKLNIEGGEYDVLERMIQLHLPKRCDSLLLQFHRLPVDYKARYQIISEQLRQSHDCLWRYEFVWEKWQLKTNCFQ
jgi:FkbM family methyltransferase